MDRPEAPGWYDDPDDETQLRYYDGILWTDHVTPRSARRSTPASTDVGWTPPGDDAASAAGTAYGHPHAGDQAPTGLPPAGQTPDGRAPDGWTPGHNPYAAPGYALPPRATGPALADGAALAQWWQRLLAALLDGLFTGLLTIIVGIVWVLDYVAVASRFVEDSVRAAETGAAPPDMLSLQTELAPLLTPLLFVSLAVGLVYQTFFLVRSGATPGKMILGITVRRVERAGPLTLVEALKRQALQIACSLVGLVPLLGLVGSIVSVLDPAWLLWDQRRQALHDKIADTVVVTAPRTPSRRPQG